MVLPNLFIPGAGKSGTSSLHDYLNQHPEIYMSKVKEPHFFSDDRYYGLGLNEYEKLFEEGKECQFRGESSTGYMLFKNVIERIKSDIPNPKFIFILRNPVDRAYSHYCWLKGMGLEEKKFRDAILHDKESTLPNNMKGVGNTGYTSYFQEGDYEKWLPKFIEAFGRNNILIILTENLGSDPLGTLNSCFSFLGLAPIASVEKIHANETVFLSRPKLYKLWLEINNHVFIRRILKGLLPTRGVALIRKLKSKSDQSLKVMLSTSEKPPTLDNEDRAWLASLYREGIDALRMETQIPFMEWVKDFPIDDVAV